MRAAAALALLFALEPVLAGQTQTREGDWYLPPPVELTADGGTTLRLLSDGSVLAGGANPRQATYTLTFQLEFAEITALRLEALTDPSLPETGPGRAFNGNFILSELRAEFEPKARALKPKPLVFAEVQADHFQPGAGNEPAQAIDGAVDDRGWCGEGHQHHERRVAVFLTSGPAGYPEGTKVRVQLVFASQQFPEHSIGRFRIGFTAKKNARLLLPPPRPPDADKIDAAIQRGVDYLLSIQQVDGSWAGGDSSIYYGMPALGALTLLKCGLDPSHPRVRKAVSWVDSRPMLRTYDCGLALMLYAALGERAPKERVREVARRLVETFQNAADQAAPLWGYPNGHPPGDTTLHTDLSNTQYALLGLRAAEKLGEKIPDAIYEKVARHLLQQQGEYGSFRYLPGRDPTASMAVAGIASLLICREELERAGRPGQLLGKIDAGIVLGHTWLQQNWSVDEVLEEPRKAKPEERWYYYYLHGLERVGSLSNQRMVGGHDWYAEASAALLRRQNENGSWSTAYGESDANTCFALLFMRRGSRPTGEPAPPALEPLDDSASAFAITCDGHYPLAAWVTRLGQPVRERLAAGEIVRHVEWRVDDAAVGKVTPAPGADPKLERFGLEVPLPHNGEHRLQAVMHFAAPDGTATASLASIERTVNVNCVEEPADREAVRDNAARLVDPRRAEADASSQWDGFPASQACDGRAVLSWLAAEDDPKPWVRIRLARPVIAAALKLTSAQPFLGDDTSWARPRSIEISLNGAKPFAAELIDNPFVKQTISFPATPVKSVRIAIKTRYPEVAPPRACGFGEIELLPPGHLVAGEELAVGAPLAPLPLAPASAKAVEWRYATAKPLPGFERLGYDASAMSSGAAPFGGAGTRSAFATPWESSELWLRHEFELAAPLPALLAVELCVDDQAEVYLNGVLAARRTTFSGGQFVALPVRPAALAALRPGINVIAVHVTNTGGAAFFDLRLAGRP